MARMDRRTFLRRVGLAAGAVPLLPSLGAAAGPNFPTRFVVYFNPNGTMPADYWPTAGATERDFRLGAILEPLARHQSYLLPLKGIDLAVAAIGPGEGHQKGMGGLLTGRELQAGQFVGGDGSRAGWGSGVSVDQVIARRIGAGTALSSLELGVRATTSEVRSRLAYRDAGEPLPPENSPRAVFERLFQAELGAADARARERSVLDAAARQLGLARRVLSTEDRLRLDDHLGLVRDLETRLQRSASMGTCAAPPRPAELAVDDESTMAEIADLQIDLLGIALVCDLTRVASLQMSNAQNGIRFPWLDSLGNGHSLSHAGPSNAEARREWIARDRWYAERLARLLDRLAASPEGDGNALDHSVVFWGNELAQGNTHSHVDMPFLLAGRGGGLAPGRLVEFATHRPHNDLLVSFLNLFGIEATTFGNPDYCTGPLPGLTA